MLANFLPDDLVHFGRSKVQMLPLKPLNVPLGTLPVQPLENGQFPEAKTRGNARTIFI